MTYPTEAVSGLIERIEAGGGRCRAIDATIYHDLLGFCRHANKERTGAQSDTGFDCMDCGADSWGNKSRKGGYPVGQGLHDSAPRYTASIDAALSLVPAGRRMVVQQRRSYEPFWVSFMLDGGTEYDATGRAKTLALAIAAAALRARETTPSIKGGDRG